MTEYHFQKLTPISDAELGIYENALNYVFEHDDIHNVAISGSYSAGKSSILASYKQKDSEKKYIHISLAHFEPTDDDVGFKENKISETELEGKILNQLIHKIEPSKIPQTNFRIKRRVSGKSVYWLTASFMAATILSLISFGTSLIKSIGNSLSIQWMKNVVLFFTKGEVRLCSGILLLAALSVALFFLVKEQKNKHILRRVGVKDVDIEIFEGDTESYFDKYLNEVLYLFESSDVNVIVFEDMDRFNVNRIFERLREINILVNERRTAKKQEPLRFFYLLRDDIFITKDRTKFFDFIIPIIPVVDSSNAFDKFKEQFEQQGIFAEFEGGFLQGISLYVDDMRILKNIFNEFLIYRNRLDTTELDINKLLAMIVYKNIFPRDFSDLQLNRGFICSLFVNKGNYIAEAIKKVSEEIEETSILIQDAKNEHLVSSKEVDDAYRDRLANLQRGYYYVDRPEYKALTSEIARRKTAVENRDDKKLAKLEEQLKRLFQEKESLSNQKLYFLLEEYCSTDEVFRDNKSTNAIGTEKTYNEIKESPYFDLLKYLVRNGYLDETYADYMSYFYPYSLSQKDKIFMRSVTDRKAKPWGFRIDNPSLVINGLRDVDFTHIEILNFDLLFHMLESQDDRQKKLLKNMLDIVVKNEIYNFVEDVYNAEEKYDLPLFTVYINNAWPLLMENAISGIANFAPTILRKYLVLTLSYCNAEIMKQINIGDSLTAYISGDNEFLDMSSVSYVAEKLLDNIENISVSFMSLDYNKSEKNLFEEVYKRSLYKLNASNIALMIEKQCGIPIDGSFWTRHFSILASIPDSNIAAYIDKHKDEHIAVVLEKCHNEIWDDVSVVENVLNDEGITIENRISYIKKLKTVLPSFENTSDVNLWGALLSQCAVEYTEENILKYYTHQGLDDALIAFIKTEKRSLDFSSWDASNRSDMFDGVVPCKELGNWHYCALLQALKNSYNDGFNIEGLADYQVDALIELEIVPLGIENLRFFRNTYPSKTLKFILANIDAYAALIDKDNYSTDEMLAVLKSTASDEQKLKLLSFEKSALPIADKGYSEAVENYILSHNFDTSEIVSLLKLYLSKPQATREILLGLASENFHTVIEKQHLFEYGLIEDIISFRTVTKSNKEQLLSLRIEFLSEEQCKKLLHIIGDEDLSSVFEGKRPKIAKSDEMEAILKAFQKKRWITSYNQEPQDGDYYRVYGRKSTDDRG